MKEIIPFLVAHWPLSVAFAMVLVAIIVVETKASAEKASAVTPQTLVQQMNHQDAVVVDVRDANAYSNGHIIHSISIPLAEFSAKKSKLNSYKHKPIVVVCYTGVSAKRAMSELLANGFGSVAVLSGGMKAWQDAGLPIEKEVQNG